LAPAVRVSLRGACWDDGEPYEQEDGFGPHQGSKAGSYEAVRQEREGHGVTRSPDRDADRADQRPHRASADAQEGSLLAPRSAHAGRTTPPVPELPAEEGSGGLSRPHQGARPAPLVP